MLVGTMFTLLVLPSVYMVLASNHSKDKNLERSAPAEGEEIKQ
jgi:multidrug efflux pump